MFTQYYYSNNIFGEKLDYFLSKGWFRSGQGVNTASIVNFEGRLYSPVRIRLALNNYQFGKKLRKRINKNKQFKTVCRKSFFSNEKENLYQQFRQKFYHQVPISLKRYLQDDFENSVFDTYEIAVFDNDKLIAVSFFDVGLKSMASILGVYDEAYASYSPGFYTMLAEIDYGCKNQFKYYYPGYIVPGFPKFDYKLRIGTVDYYEPSKDAWFPFEEMIPNQLPAIVIEEKLIQLSGLLKTSAIEHQIMYYPYLDKGFINYIDEQTELASPLFIRIYDLAEQQNIAIEYNYEKGTYQLGSYIGFEFLIEGNPYYTSHHQYPTFESCLIKSSILFESSDMHPLLKVLKSYR